VRDGARVKRPVLLVVRAQALSAPVAAEETCRNCGVRLAEDQEWCLECGAARTLLRRPPDWRIPVAITVVVVGLVVLALLLGLVILSIQAGHA
jgi:hypothetical protein